MKQCYFILWVIIFAGCQQPGNTKSLLLKQIPIQPGMEYHYLKDIPPPQNFKRIENDTNSFERSLRNLPLKKDKTVYLFNGKIKPNQRAQFAVVDITTGNSDLQQCADVVMRLRAEYLFAQKNFTAIRFMDYNGKWYNWNGGSDRLQFDKYLQLVFGWCGSASLEKQLELVKNYDELKAGDVFIKGGFPGHAMIVADVAFNLKGEKVFMLIQGYQPAQDVHIVINSQDSTLNPWYKLTNENQVFTPEWLFYKNQLHTW